MILCTVFLFLCFMWFPVRASEQKSLSTQIQEQIVPFIEWDEDNIPFVNIDELQKNTADSDLLSIATVTNEMSEQIKQTHLTKNDIIHFVMRGIAPTYGNWCGDGHTMDDPNGFAIDSLDWSCKNHDLCYRDSGYGNVECDRTFIRALKHLLDNKDTLLKNGYARAYAGAAYLYFSVLRNYGG